MGSIQDVCMTHRIPLHRIAVGHWDVSLHLMALWATSVISVILSTPRRQSQMSLPFHPPRSEIKVFGHRLLEFMSLQEKRLRRKQALGLLCIAISGQIINECSMNIS